MLNLIIRKWIEPYKLLEAIKTNATMKEYSFDGSNKTILKEHFLKELKDDKNFGLYMKNVNKFYIFDTSINIKEILVNEFNLSPSDYEITEDNKKPFEEIDSGKAEASVIMY